ncbi:ParA family protein, partial [Escherichia coli]|nr:ParA family protein [Escherichia coli]
MNILPVVSTKGGEGKSTQSANLAGFLADAGLRTLLIDGDHAQPTASNIFPLTYEAPAGLFELLMRTADLSHPDNIISRTAIDGLDLIVSNDPHEQLKTAMLHAPDGRLRLRNVLQHPLFQSYDVIVVDSQGARSVMLEMIVLSATESVVGMVNPVLPDVREFIRGTVNVMENLLPYRELGIPLPKVRTLVNCMDYTALARQTLAELTDIINSGRYSKVLPEGAVTLLSTQIYDLNIYKQGHAAGQPVHRLEKASARRSDSALVTMHSLACELLPEWSEFFDVLLENGG